MHETRSFFDWFNANLSDQRPWLILGKGPSYARIDDIDCSGFRLCGLNHVVQDRPVELAHCVDIDVVEHCGEAFLRDAGYLVMPWIPHTVRKQRGGSELRKPGSRTLDEWCESMPALDSLRQQGRLLWYNLSTGRGRNRLHAPVIRVEGFSASTMVNLLALAGAPTIRSLGVDGGNQYANAFDHLKETTLLSDGQSSYDLQFKGIARAIYETGVDYASLAEEHPIRIFVGMEPEQELAYDVLCSSIRRHASMTTHIQPLYKAIAEAGISIPLPQMPENQPRTPFSFQRFAIPELAGFRGRAIYLDSDMQVFDDIRKLWLADFEGAQLLSCTSADPARAPQYSVMLLDASKLQWNVTDIVKALDEGKWTYAQLMTEMAPADRKRASLPESWNSLESWNEGTRLLHYTDMNTQPWLNVWSPLARLWCEELLRAIAHGDCSVEKVRENVEKGWVRPSLIWQVENQISDPLLIPKRWLNRDVARFLPPHVVAGTSGIRQIGFRLQQVRAWLRWVATGLFVRTRSAWRNLRDRPARF